MQGELFGRLSGRAAGGAVEGGVQGELGGRLSGKVGGVTPRGRAERALVRAARFDGDQSLLGGRDVVAAGRAVGQEIV